MKSKRAALYCRVSTSDQNPDLQQTELKEYCQFRKWEVAELFTDTISGAKDRRPALDRMLAEARRGHFDVIVCWRFDRFARCTSHLLRSLEEFQSLGIDFVSLREFVDTSTPTGKAVFTIIAAIAELERSTIRERVIAGQKAAKRRGVRFGRPIVDVDVEAVQKLRREGLSWRSVSAQMGVPKDTLIRRFARQ